MKKFLVLFLSLFLFINVNASNKIYLFYGETCPRCHEFLEFISKDDYDIEYYEVYNNKSNNELLSKVAQAFGDEKYGVPYIVIGNQRIIGWGDTIKDQFFHILKNNTGCDMVDSVINNKECKLGETLDNKVKVPIIGFVDNSSAIIGLIGVLTGIVDGFNPFSLFVLIYLLTSIKDKKKSIKTGILFILINSIVYYIFINCLGTIMSSLSFIKYINYGIGLILILCSLYNLFEFLRFKESNYMNDKVINKIAHISAMDKKYVVSIIILSLIVTFASINVSVGLPLFYTSLLSLNDISLLNKSIYILVYILFYMIDDLIILLLYALSMNIDNKKYIRYSYLICFIFMAIFGILLLIKPELLLVKV